MLGGATWKKRRLRRDNHLVAITVMKLMRVWHTAANAVVYLHSCVPNQVVASATESRREPCGRP